MKKILTLGLLAVVAALASSQSANAWTNCKFSIGLNWSCQSGNNNFLWGLWHNGQVPEDGYGPGHGPAYNALPPGYGPAYPPGTQPFPFYGTNRQQQNQQNMPTATNSTSYYHQASYQPSYPAQYTPASYGYSYPGYYYPSYSPGYGDGFGWFGQ
jgi:hypothetical protein